MLLCYAILGSTVALHEFARPKAVLCDFLSIFNIFFITSYILPPCAFLYYSDYATDWNYLSKVPHAANSIPVFIAIFLGYLSVAYGFAIGNRTCTIRHAHLHPRFGPRTQYIFMSFFGLLSLSSFVIYAYGHGGIVQLILSAKLIRKGEASAGILQYFLYFSSGLTYSALLFATFARDPRIGRLQHIARAKFFVFTVLALAQAAGTAGRGNIGMIALLLTTYWLTRDMAGLNLRKVLILLVLLIGLYSLIAYGKHALWTLPTISDGPEAYASAFSESRNRAQITSDGFGSDVVSFARYFDHHFSSVYVAISNPDAYQAPRLAFDWIRTVLDSAPGISRPDFVVTSTASALNRDYFRADGYVPPNWVAMKLINGGFAWLAVGSAIAGLFGGALNRLLILSWRSSPIIPAVFVWAAFFWKDYIVGPDPFEVILSNLPTVLLLAIGSVLFTIRRPAINNLLQDA